MSRHAFLIVLLSMLVLPGFVEASGWYSAEPASTGHKGWYAYQKYAQKDKDKDKKDKDKEKKKNKKQRNQFYWPSYQEALKMKPADLKKILEKAAEEAIANPTEENVVRWATYMKAAREKSVNFAGALSYVLLKHPELSYAPDFPINFPASRALSLARTQKIKEFFRKHKENFALVLLVSKRSPLSSPAEKICRMFAEKYQWKLAIIDADSRPDISRKLKVKYVPQAFIISRNPEIQPLPVMIGAEALSVLQQNIYNQLQIALGLKQLEKFGTDNLRGLVRVQEN